MKKETGFLLLVVALLLIPWIFKKFVRGAPKKDGAAYDKLIRQYADTNGIPFATLKGVVAQESTFDPAALGDGGRSVGLMQIQQAALTDFNRANETNILMSDLFRPEINIRVGSWYLGQLIKRHGVDVGIEMYNVGETGYKKGRRSPEHVAKVKGYAASFA